METKSKTIQEQIEVPGFLRISKIVIWTVYGFILLGIVTLILRVILLALSANQTSGFVELIASISQDYMQPFRGIFPPRMVGETGYLDVSALFAIVVYLFAAWGVNSLIDYVQNKIDISKAEQRARLLELRAKDQAKRREEMRKLELEAIKAKKAKQTRTQ